MNRPSIGNLNKLFGFDPSNITSIIDSLESKQLVLRAENNKDRRMKLVRLTPLGIKVRTKLLNELKNSDTMFNLISPAKIDAFSQVIKDLLDTDRAA
jgi:DNA-binding MarR family transcriptional regulator